MPQVTIHRDRCKGCELCKDACPQKIIEMSKEINVKGYYPSEIADSPRCIGCCICAINCPDQAIEVGANGARYKLFEY